MTSSLNDILHKVPAVAAGHIAAVRTDHERFTCDLDLPTGAAPPFPTIRPHPCVAVLHGAPYRHHSSSTMARHHRLYGLCCPCADKLQAQLDLLHQAKQSDCRDLGERLQLFTMSGDGPRWQPRGDLLCALIADPWQQTAAEHGLRRVTTAAVTLEERCVAHAAFAEDVAELGPLASASRHHPWQQRLPTASPRVDLLTWHVTTAELANKLQEILALAHRHWKRLQLPPPTFRLHQAHPDHAEPLEGLLSVALGSSQKVVVPIQRHQEGASVQACVVDPLGRESWAGSFSLRRRGDKVLIHLQLLGSLEHQCALLLEHGSGHLPFFLTPLQVAILPVSEHQHAAAEELFHVLRDSAIRAEVWPSDRTLGARVRLLHHLAVPCACILGEREIAAKLVALRHTRSGRNDRVDRRHLRSMLRMMNDLD